MTSFDHLRRVIAAVLFAWDTRRAKFTSNHPHLCFRRHVQISYLKGTFSMSFKSSKPCLAACSASAIADIFVPTGHSRMVVTPNIVLTVGRYARMMHPTIYRTEVFRASNPNLLISVLMKLATPPFRMPRAAPIKTSRYVFRSKKASLT